MKPKKKQDQINKWDLMRKKMIVLLFKLIFLIINHEDQGFTTILLFLNVKRFKNINLIFSEKKLIKIKKKIEATYQQMVEVFKQS